MIEFIELARIAENWPDGNDGLLKLDGFTIEPEKCEIRVLGGYLNLFINDLQLRDAILAHSFCDLPDQWLSLTLPQDKTVIDDPSILVSIRIQKQKKCVTQVYISFNFENWKHTWSAAEYGREILQKLNEIRFAGVTLDTGTSGLFSDGFSLSIQTSSTNLAMETEVSRLIEAVAQLHDVAIASLTSQIENRSVSTLFDFPEPVRVPCEQYLLYFVQFLKDLGVEATAELRHQSGHVLFAVTPADKNEALDKIRTALDAYCSLPMGNLSGAEHDPTLQQLASNVYHLKGQLALAHAVLQAKDATIQAQRITLIQQEHLLSGEVIVDSLRRTTPREYASEPVLDGMAEITKYEGKGFNVNLPEIYRRLRQLFKEK